MGALDNNNKDFFFRGLDVDDDDEAESSIAKEGLAVCRCFTGGKNLECDGKLCPAMDLVGARASNRATARSASL